MEGRTDGQFVIVGCGGGGGGYGVWSMPLGESLNRDFGPKYVAQYDRGGEER